MFTAERVIVMRLQGFVFEIGPAITVEKIKYLRDALLLLALSIFGASAQSGNELLVKPPTEF